MSHLDHNPWVSFSLTWCLTSSLTARTITMSSSLDHNVSELTPSLPFGSILRSSCFVWKRRNLLKSVFIQPTPTWIKPLTRSLECLILCVVVVYPRFAIPGHHQGECLVRLSSAFVWYTVDRYRRIVSNSANLSQKVCFEIRRRNRLPTELSICSAENGFQSLSSTQKLCPEENVFSFLQF